MLTKDKGVSTPWTPTITFKSDLRRARISPTAVESIHIIKVT